MRPILSTMIAALACNMASMTAAPALAANTVIPVFEKAPCDLPGLPEKEAKRLTCGSVAVPRLYDQPEAGQFRLAVVIVRSDERQAVSDPVVYLAGGPGFELTATAARRMKEGLAPRRDLILIDQRATGRSEPRLCEGSIRDRISTLAADLTVAAAFDAAQATARKCLEEAREQGLAPESFGTSVTVRDVEQVRQALGIKRWNVYGVSYGTTVAMTLAAGHPETIRSMVLDSVYLPDPLPLDPRAAFAQARAALFALCAADKACSGSYPDLPGLYDGALARLNREPLRVPVAEALGLPGNVLVLNRGDFEQIIHQLLYDRSSYAHLPALIAAVHDGKTEALTRVMNGVARKTGTLSLLAYAAVECRDRPHHRARKEAVSGIDNLKLWDACPAWSDLGPAPLVPAGSAIPTLVLAGSVDPMTPPISGQKAASMIGPAAQYVEVAGVGHSVQRSTACGQSLVASFFENPAAPLDKTCAAASEPISFLPPQR